ncbi:MAG: hypothetical protein BWY45_03372 [Euryarchaeota archaeon ADurb.Bin294]|nr:MAG: hypothetical protein BWY45_03372 [Euryarchaeota archaeon ADurb.Bin294]
MNRLPSFSRSGILQKAGPLFLILWMEDNREILSYQVMSRASGETLTGMIYPGDMKPGVPDDYRSTCIGNQFFKVFICLSQIFLNRSTGNCSSDGIGEGEQSLLLSLIPFIFCPAVVKSDKSPELMVDNDGNKKNGDDPLSGKYLPFTFRMILYKARYHLSIMQHLV